MLKIILKKVAEVTVVMLLISIFSFAIIELAPGDISSMYISADMSPEEQEMVMEKLGLNKSGTERYIEWLKEAVKGNWGYSISYKLPVADMLVKRLPSTLLLMGTSLLVSLILSIPVGLIAGY